MRRPKLRLLSLSVSLAVVSSPACTPLVAQTLDVSQVWYADLLRQHFPTTIENGGSTFPLDEIVASRVDVTRFDVDVVRRPSQVTVGGSVTIRALPDGFSVIDGANGRRYMLYLDAFIFGPSGHVLWKQHGFPQRGAWTHADGETKRFVLIDAPRVQIPQGSILLVLASGDPIFSTGAVTRVILGAKTIRF